MILIIDCGSSKVPDFVKVYSKWEVKTLVVNYKDWRDAYENYEVSSIIISGAPKLLTQEPVEPYLETFNGIDELDVPVLGVCFGHQIIGILNGSEVYLCEEDRDWQDIQLLNKTCLLLDDLPSDKIKMMQDHTEAITLADGFELVGSSVICDVEMVQNIERGLYGVQFHPEVSGEQGANLLKNFAKLSGLIQ